MGRFEVEPAELRAGGHRLRDAAGRLRDVAAGLGTVQGGAELRGGLDDALARFAEHGRDGHRRIADRADEVAARLTQAADLYEAVDAAVRRGAGG